jgi:hypothetical protein
LKAPKRKDRSGWAIAKAIFGAPVFHKPFTGFEIRKGQFRTPKDGGGQMNTDGLALVSAIFSMKNSQGGVICSARLRGRIIMNRMTPITNRIWHRRWAVSWIPIRATRIYFNPFTSPGLHFKKMTIIADDAVVGWLLSSLIGRSSFTKKRTQYFSTRNPVNQGAASDQPEDASAVLFHHG